MNWILILVSTILISLLSILLGGKPAHAALRPLDPDTLKEEAEAIVVGTVQAVYHREASVGAGTNHEYLALLTVHDAEKGFLKSPALIYVHYWQVGQRPPGWAGPGGQFSGLPLDTQVRVFLRSDQQGSLHLLEPNGWEKLAAE